MPFALLSIQHGISEAASESGSIAFKDGMLNILIEVINFKFEVWIVLWRYNAVEDLLVF